MRRRYRRKKKLSSLTIILIFICLLCFLGIGYSKWETVLTISGTVTSTQSSTGSAGRDLIISQHLEGTGDGSLKNDGNEYYFSGSSSEVENYFYFNSELWRIMAIDDSGIKIQRIESLGKMTWNDTPKMQVWADCTLNDYLNTTYFSTITDTSNIVLNPVWNVGTSEDGKTIPTRVDYSGTSDDPRPVGILNVQEMTNSGGSSGWLLDGEYFWTMTRCYKE